MPHKNTAIHYLLDISNNSNLILVPSNTFDPTGKGPLCTNPGTILLASEFRIANVTEIIATNHVSYRPGGL